MNSPPADTVERWAWDFLATTELAAKLLPAAPPKAWEESAPPRRIQAPGRPRELVVTERAPKSPGKNALRSLERRAQIVHTFLHHELQAAELMAWALLAFPETPRAFRVGLLKVLFDEVRHMGLYRDYLRDLGFDYGAFPVRDWFWQRVPQSQGPVQFVAVMGMGFEGGNLDHTVRFAERFRRAGDLAGAALQEKVCAEEVPHVRFALHWFEVWTARPQRGVVNPGAAPSTNFTEWAAHLPAPLSPMVMRGTPLNRADRLRSGFSEQFLDELTEWSPQAPGF